MVCVISHQGVANAFRTLKGIVSRPKALELVRRHPGLVSVIEADSEVASS